jgi:hypothetical protein
LRFALRGALLETAVMELYETLVIFAAADTKGRNGSFET